MGKVLGIIGGMGPLATVKLFENIVLSTKANKDQEHIHILIDNNTLIPDRTDYILNKSSKDPKMELINSALKLEKMGADYLVMPCNTAHHFYNDIIQSINIPFLNMINETAKYIIENYKEVKKIGLLATEGTIKAKVYDNIFESYGIEIITPAGDTQKYITQLIYNIKEDLPQENLDKVYNIMDELKEKGVDLFIAGCTEISVAIDLYDLKGDIIDPMKVLTLKAIEFAGKNIKEI